jgi:hypothetical protein
MNPYTIILPATVFTHHIIIIIITSHSELILKDLEGSLSQCHFVNHNFHILAWDWTQTSMVGGKQLTLIAKTCPNKDKTSNHCSHTHCFPTSNVHFLWSQNVNITLWNDTESTIPRSIVFLHQLFRILDP